jgi:hypothetical protein
VQVPAQFYQKVFGMQEVHRLTMGPSMEIMLNCGASEPATTRLHSSQRTDNIQ